MSTNYSSHGIRLCVTNVSAYALIPNYIFLSSPSFLAMCDTYIEYFYNPIYRIWQVQYAFA